MEKDTRVRRKPPTKTKSSGVHTCYLGRPEDPILKAVEAYCIMNQKTVSEACRDFIKSTLTDKGLIKNGTLTPEGIAFREEALAKLNSNGSRSSNSVEGTSP